MSSVCLLIADGIFHYKFSLKEGKQAYSSKFSKNCGGAFGKEYYFWPYCWNSRLPTQRIRWGVLCSQ